MEFIQLVENYAIRYSNYNQCLSEYMGNPNAGTGADLDNAREQLQEVIADLRKAGLAVNVGAIHKTQAA